MTLAEGVPGTWGIRCALWLLGVFFPCSQNACGVSLLGIHNQICWPLTRLGQVCAMLHDHVRWVLSFVGVGLCDLSRCFLRTYQLL